MSVFAKCGKCGKDITPANGEIFLTQDEDKKLTPKCSDCIPLFSANLICGRIFQGYEDVFPLDAIILFEGCTVEQLNEHTGEISISYNKKSFMRKD